VKRTTARDFHIVHSSIVTTTLVPFDFLCEGREARCTGFCSPPISIKTVFLVGVATFACHFEAVHPSIVITTLVTFHADLKAGHGLPV
jgi:hypothetical protein